jgi:hypothetical protein
MKEIYTPMEKVLIEGAKLAEGGTVPRETEPTTAELCAAALKTKNDTAIALLLDLMILEAEEKLGLMDGIPVEGWAL